MARNVLNAPMKPSIIVQHTLAKNVALEEYTIHKQIHANARTPLFSSMVLFALNAIILDTLITLINYARYALTIAFITYNKKCVFHVLMKPLILMVINAQFVLKDLFGVLQYEIAKFVKVV